MNKAHVNTNATPAVQPPENPSAVARPVPAYRLYDWASVAIATLFGSPIAGTGLMALNYSRLGKSSRAARIFAIGASVTVVAIAFSSRMPSYATSAVAVGLLLATMNAAKLLQGGPTQTHVQNGGRLASRWAAFGIGLASLAIIFASAVGFVVARQEASKIVVGSHNEVYFSGAAKKQDARALAAALEASGYFRGNYASVFLSKGPSGTTITFVVKDGVWNQPDMISGFEEVGREVAPSVGGFPIQVLLATSGRQTRKELTVGKLIVGTRDELYYLGSATKSDAKALGQSLKSSGFLQDRGVSVFLSKGNGETAISFVLREDAWNNPQNVAVFEALVRRAAGSLGGFPLELRLLNSHLDLEKEVQVGK